ncbi:MAG: MFS transporter [Succinivibrio sp.]
MNKKLLLWAVTSALAGFLFGFDTVVISGAESKIQQLWSLSGTAHGLAISAALWGTVLGALFGSIPTAKYGRRYTLIANGVLFLLGAIGSCIAWDVYSFFFFRFIGGIGIGISTVAAPLFISEISPAGDRGKLTGLFQFNIVFGILMAFFSNFAINHLVCEEFAWRWMLGIQVIPSLLYTVMCLSLPESPRYLIANRKDYEHGRYVFSLINPKMSPEELDGLVESVKAESASEKKSQGSTASFFSAKLKYPILFAFLIAAFNQLSGINIILYFAPRLLGLAGLEDPVAASVALGVTNLIATFIGIRLIDVLGRRTLLLIGCVGYILSLGICTFSFFNYDELKVVSVSMDTISSANQLVRMENGEVYYTQDDLDNARNSFAQSKSKLKDIASLQNMALSESLAVFDGDNVTEIRDTAIELKHAASESLGSVSATVLVCMIAFIASHAIGSGTIIWVFISEIFPNEFRARGQALGSFTHWIFAAGLTLVFPIAIATFDAGFMFGFFTFMMILQLVFAFVMMPETKGRSLEEIAKTLSSD